MSDAENLPLNQPLDWESPSSDPNDETFGDIVEIIDPENVDDYDAVFVGEPFDAAVVGRPGSSAGPNAIRESLAGVKTYHFDSGRVNVSGDRDSVNIADVGNVELDGFAPGSDADVTTIRNVVEQVALRLYESSATPVFLGGDNSLTVPNVRSLMATVPDEETVGVVNFDAHLDVREAHDVPTSGTPYRELLEEGLAAYVIVGARDFETSGEYVTYLQEQGGTVVTSREVGSDLEGALSRVRETLADVDHLYCSVDCDVLDAAAAPGVSAPTPGGLTTRELFRLVGSVATDQRLRGVEVVECAPPLDRDGQTVDAAARTVAHALAGLLTEGDQRGETA